ncbi:agmatine deiminase family protein [Streptomyces sp. OF3]|uniref:Agmatine deiminase family protein n=1 Tax=Streptomyces alkaliterrae TaxID=2213162 RepID=A0A7W3WLF1_9ACTN|nr:agmatine deiminase family protein [Streptomyces alkaliterrae]MBB1254521.1 agmatine deiminase family protein [Streptomyces alkaliterrae]
MSGSDRRTVLRALVAAAAGSVPVAACASGGGAGHTKRGTGETGEDGDEEMTEQPKPSRSGWRLPAETEPHDRTYLAWPPEDSVWDDLLPGLRRDIASIARAVAEYEPVTLLADPRNAADARRACGSGVEVLPVPVDDVWVRDTGPVFVTNPRRDRLAGVDLRFNGWGGRATRRARDERVARAVLAGAGVPRTVAGLVAEGGGIEVDGRGTLMATESSLVNPNRNPGMSRDEIERALREAFGVTRVLWLAGVRGRDVTDHHVDSLARFTPGGAVLLSRPPLAGDGDGGVWTRAYEQAGKALAEATDARGRRLETVDLPEPDPRLIGRRGPDFLACYANYYVVNGALIAPRYGDRRADETAAAVLREHHPGRRIVSLPIDTLAEGGGGIHCATRERPAVKAA